MTTRNAVATTLAVVMIVGAHASRAWAAEGDATFGGQWWYQTAREAKYQEFRQVPLGALLESYRLEEWSQRTGFALWGANGMLNDQAARLTASHGARWRADLGYTEIPHTFSHIASWGWNQVTPGVFLIPDTLQARNQQIPAGFPTRMQDFTKSAPVIGLDFGSNISTARLRARPTRGWQFEARGALRNRAGMKPYGITFGSPGTGPLENPEPIDQRTVDADFIANWQRNGTRVKAMGGVSIFDNAVSTLLVDNPRANTDVLNNARQGALDLYPDNEQLRGSVAVTTLLPRRSTLSATLGMSQTTQDDPWLGFTTNTAIVTGPASINDSLPAKSADAKAVQLNADARVNSRLTQDLTGVLRFQYSDYDNQTPERNFLGRVPYDNALQRYTELHNKAYANTQWHTGVDLDYSFSPAVKVGATYEYRDRERTHREVDKDTENVFKGKARYQPTDVLQITAEYRHGDRQLDQFLLEDYIGLVVPSGGNLFSVPDTLEQPDLRRYDVANRVQDRADAGVNYVFSERFEAGASYIYLKNDYKDSKMGLQDETEHNFVVDGTLHLNERIDLNGAYGYGLSETNQASRQSGSASPSNLPSDNWAANLKDTNVYVAAGFAWWLRPEKLSLAADYWFSRQLQEFDLSNATNTAVDVPQTIYRLHDVTVDASYRWLRNFTIIGRYGWEEYDVVDFATNNVPLVFPATTSAAIYLGDSSQSYKAHRLALLARWTF